MANDISKSTLDDYKMKVLEISLLGRVGSLI